MAKLPTILLPVIGLAIMISAMSASSSIAQTDPPFKDVKNPTEIKAAEKVFNDYLNRLSPAAQVTLCDMVLNSHPGRVEDIYAGLCRTKSKALVMVCGDTGIGEFGLGFWGGNIDPSVRDTLIHFARANCPGG